MRLKAAAFRAGERRLSPQFKKRDAMAARNYSRHTNAA
jgi:hypothetical protein